MRSGTTVLELALALALVGLVGAAVGPAVRAGGDRLAVAAAREAAAGLLIRTRTEAMMRGGATLHASAADRRVWVQAGDSLITQLRLGDEFGVDLFTGGSRELTLAFDALGIGRRASATLVFKRGVAEAALVIAAYGRAVRS